MYNIAADPTHAIRSFQSEKEHEFRCKFSRDRDRILYSTEFRRLDRKTQVFVSSFDDNNRNRLTHTIEVAQIAKTLAKYFNLNQELTEAIAYGHDVGHTPFGHTGERTLNLILNGCEKFSFVDNVRCSVKGFKHNWQSLRVLTKLEKISDCYDGLNLTDYTLWGILHHTNRCYNLEDDKVEFAGEVLNQNKCSYYSENQYCTLLRKNGCHNRGSHYLAFYDNLKRAFRPYSWTLEALIVRVADEIAQRHHDIEDGINARIIDNKELIEIITTAFGNKLSSVEKGKLTKLCKEQENHVFIKDLTNFIISFYVNSVKDNSQENLKKLISDFGISNQYEFHELKPSILKSKTLAGILNLVGFEQSFQIADASVKKYLKERILNSHLAQTMDCKSNLIISEINNALMINPAQLPDKTITTLFKNYYTVENYKKETAGKSAPSIAGMLRGKLKSLQLEHTNKEFLTTLQRTIGDFISGMTDSYALRQYEKLFGTTELKNY